MSVTKEELFLLNNGLHNEVLDNATPPTYASDALKKYAEKAEAKLKSLRESCREAMSTCNNSYTYHELKNAIKESE